MLREAVTKMLGAQRPGPLEQDKFLSYEKLNLLRRKKGEKYRQAARSAPPPPVTSSIQLVGAVGPMPGGVVNCREFLDDCLCHAGLEEVVDDDVRERLRRAGCSIPSTPDRS